MVERSAARGDPDAFFGPRPGSAGILKDVKAFLLAVMASGLLHCTPRPTAPDVADASPRTAHAWRVYDGDVEILSVNDTPGPILSTAALPPGAMPIRHRFLSASARSARHESKLREILNASTDVPDFLARLRDAGFVVRPAD